MSVMAAFYLIKFTPLNKPKVKDLILKFIVVSEGVLNNNNKQQYILLTSSVSNLFYKNDLRRESLDLKR